MKQSEWDAYLNWTDPKPEPPEDTLSCAKGVGLGVIAGSLMWLVLLALWAAFKAARVFW